jgi:protein TonB
VGASVLLHVATAAGLLFLISAAPPARTPLVIDLTIGGPWGAGVSAAPAPSAGHPRPEAPSPVPAPPAPVAPVPAAMPDPLPAPPKETTPVAANPAPPDRQAEVAAPRPPRPAGGIERAAAAPGPGAVSGASVTTVPAVAGFAHGASPGASSARAATGAGADAEEPGVARAKGQGRYLERDFAYIRDAIQQGIAYPAMARRMGWEGRVVVSFLVLSDGSVRDVRVVQGSGHSALDRGAVDAVRKAAPFPRPPAEAEIITPVVYRLD